MNGAHESERMTCAQPLRGLFLVWSATFFSFCRHDYRPLSCGLVTWPCSRLPPFCCLARVHEFRKSRACRQLRSTLLQALCAVHLES